MRGAEGGQQRFQKQDEERLGPAASSGYLGEGEAGGEREVCARPG